MSRLCVLVAAALALVASIGASGRAGASSPNRERSIQVTTGVDQGPGSFRDAISRASDNPAIRFIRVDRGVEIQLLSPVVYTGSQELSIAGHGNSVSGSAGDASLHPSWMLVSSFRGARPI